MCVQHSTHSLLIITQSYPTVYYTSDGINTKTS